MSLFVVDVESDGPIPNKYSMVCFGVVRVDSDIKTTFYGKTKPISNEYISEALAISGISREQHLTFDDPKEVMLEFKNWIGKVNLNGRPIFISDNLAYDWQFINYYFHYFLGDNPFGYSGRRIGDIYSGIVKNMYKGSEWKKFRITKHTHNPVDDAKGNVEALLRMGKEYRIQGLI
jgi:hypothetical protein